MSVEQISFNLSALYPKQAISMLPKEDQEIVLNSSVDATLVERNENNSVLIQIKFFAINVFFTKSTDLENVVNSNYFSCDVLYAMMMSTSPTDQKKYAQIRKLIVQSPCCHPTTEISQNGPTNKRCFVETCSVVSDLTTDKPQKKNVSKLNLKENEVWWSVAVAAVSQAAAVLCMKVIQVVKFKQISTQWHIQINPS